MNCYTVYNDKKSDKCTNRNRIYDFNFYALISIIYVQILKYRHASLSYNASIILLTLFSRIFLF